MKVKDVINTLEDLSPLAYSEDFDNTGLLVGNAELGVQGILVTLDTIEEVVDEARQKGCNLIVSFHPIIFSGLKSLTGRSYVERAVMKAIKNDISIIAVHTALDNAWNGVNAKMSEALGLTNKRILIPKSGTIQKLVTFVPPKAADNLRNALFEAGAGNIGNYSNCSFNIEGQGSFMGNEDSNPTIGEKGVTNFESEIRLGVTYLKHLKGKVLKALFEAHPYEEVAYEITTLENSNQHIGMGMTGLLEKDISEDAFLNKLREVFGTPGIRHSKKTGKSIRKVAVLGGSGSFAIEAAKAAGADAFVTSDLKYHDYYKAENGILLTDIGHHESEQFTKDLIVAHLKEKITNFAPALPEGKILAASTNTNPIFYY